MKTLWVYYTDDIPSDLDKLKEIFINSERVWVSCDSFKERYIIYTNTYNNEIPIKYNGLRRNEYYNYLLPTTFYQLDGVTNCYRIGASSAVTLFKPISVSTKVPTSNDFIELERIKHKYFKREEICYYLSENWIDKEEI